MKNLYNDLDLYAIDVDNLTEWDEDLQRFLAYNPRHNKITNEKFQLGLSDEEIYNFDRPIIETDRSGWRGYHKVYSKYISHLRNEPIRLMEIGIQEGWGLLAWQRYFTSGEIHGIEKSKQYRPVYEKIRNDFPESKDIVFRDELLSNEKDSWEKFYQPEYFDVIIDDGSHDISTQIQTLKIAFDYVKPGGFYFIEDIKPNLQSQLVRVPILLDLLESIKGFEIYRHVNVEHQEYTALPRQEKIKVLRKKAELENWKNIDQRIQSRLETDTGISNNYMAVIKKSMI